MSIVAFVFFLFAASPAFAGGFGPWTFGMSADQIRSVKAQGPYRAFSNGGLETYNAEFGGKAQNAQFYFNGEFVFSSFNSIAQVGVKTYMVTVNYDEPSP